MRKILLSIAIMLVSMICFATNEEKIEILLQVNYYNNGSGSGKPHRVPSPVPEVSIEGHTLYFGDNYRELSVKLVSVESGVTYELGIVSEEDESVDIPSFLSGKYNIILTRGDVQYEGIIEL